MLFRSDDISLSIRVRIPANVAPGTHKVSLWMPDDAASLRADARYASIE